MAIHPRQSQVSFTGRGRRAWTRGSPACRAASQSCRGRRWPCPSEPPACSRSPPRTDGPRCWRDTPDWRLRLSYRPNPLQRGRQSHDFIIGIISVVTQKEIILFMFYQVLFIIYLNPGIPGGKMKHTFKIIYHSASFKSAMQAHMHVMFTSGCCLTVLCI